MTSEIQHCSWFCYLKKGTIGKRSFTSSGQEVKLTCWFPPPCHSQRLIMAKLKEQCINWPTQLFRMFLSCLLDMSRFVWSDRMKQNTMIQGIMEAKWEEVFRKAKDFLLESKLQVSSWKIKLFLVPCGRSNRFRVGRFICLIWIDIYLIKSLRVYLIQKDTIFK